MGAEDLTPRIIIADAIAETLQYEFDTSTITVSSKHTKLPAQEEDLKLIVGIEAIKTIQNSKLPRHTIKKSHKSSLSPEPKVLPPNPIDNHETSDNYTVRNILKKNHHDSAPIQIHTHQNPILFCWPPPRHISYSSQMHQHTTP